MIFSTCFLVLFSPARFRLKAVVAECHMPENHGFYKVFLRSSSFTVFRKILKNVTSDCNFHTKNGTNLLENSLRKMMPKIMKIFGKMIQNRCRNRHRPNEASGTCFFPILVGFSWILAFPGGPEFRPKSLRGPWQKKNANLFSTFFKLIGLFIYC